MKPRKLKHQVAFEESIGDDWGKDLNIVEVPIGGRPLFYLGLVVLGIVLIVLGRVGYLALANGGYYGARAAENIAYKASTPAPRGIIYDREGNPLVTNKAAFAALLDPRAFFLEPAKETSTLAAIEKVLGIPAETVLANLQEKSKEDFATPIVLAEDLAENEIVNLKALDLPAVHIESTFDREYPDGPVFSSVVGYIGRVNKSDLEGANGLTAQDFVGKTGVEAYYNTTLMGTPGVDVTLKDAQGRVLGEDHRSLPAVGGSVKLTIDGGLQKYLYDRLSGGLRSLGRQVGIGLAIDPETGEVLSLVNLPGFDNNVLSNPSGKGAEIENLLTSKDKPLFDRVVSGMYNPGSTIKPLVGVAALKEGVIDPSRTLFSPGYILVPNPYNSSTPSRYLDWRYQGTINLSSAIAQSSDVYFYVVGGGSPQRSVPLLNDPSDYGIAGLGIGRLTTWWQTFALGTKTGIDLPNEASGFLPTPAWKESHLGTPWLLGDSYNVSIGQGDLLLTPLQLLDYVDAIANGGKIYRPFVNASSTPSVLKDISDLGPQIAEVEKGMREAVTSPLGTAHLLSGLPFDACAKTGSAQVQNNTQENALFVGYAPCDHPKIALLILIENSKEGSLNAVPIAKDVLGWYYENRIVGR